MKPLDRLLQRWRIARAARWLPPNARVLDIGCADGALFRQLGARIRGGVGIDHDLSAPMEIDGVRLLPGSFPDDLPPSVGTFDAITMLAVLEHVPVEKQGSVADACWRLLRSDGRLVISVPSPLVDPILDFLVAVRIVDGMSLEEHFGFEVSATPDIFRRFRLLERERFELGFNNLFVFERA